MLYKQFNLIKLRVISVEMKNISFEQNKKTVIVKVMIKEKVTKR